MKKKKFRKFVRLPNGKQDSATFERKTDADAWFRRRKLEVQKSKALGIEQVEVISFRDAAEKWFKYSQNINQQKTNYEYNSIITNHLNPMFGKQKITELRRSEAESDR